MGKLENFLASLSDVELAIFIAYRYEGFIGTSKQKIKDVVAGRNLTEERLEQLYRKGLPSPSNKSVYCCPRCNSTKLYVETDNELRTVRYSSYEVAVDTLRCRLCGYNPNKRSPKNLIDAIKLKFMGRKIVRIPKQDEKVFKGL